VRLPWEIVDRSVYRGGLKPSQQTEMRAQWSAARKKVGEGLGWSFAYRRGENSDFMAPGLGGLDANCIWKS
jgi:hypothetical protein